MVRSAECLDNTVRPRAEANSPQGDDTVSAGLCQLSPELPKLRVAGSNPVSRSNLPPLETRFWLDAFAFDALVTPTPEAFSLRQPNVQWLTPRRDLDLG
jgi:hypothetical protein